MKGERHDSGPEQGGSLAEQTARPTFGLNRSERRSGQLSDKPVFRRFRADAEIVTMGRRAIHGPVGICGSRTGTAWLVIWRRC